MGRCVVVGAGEFAKEAFCLEPGDFVIAADGGYLPLSEMGVTPHLLVGDFDSLPALPEGIPTLRFPAEKDDTDMGLALETGYDKGFRQFVLFGGSGSRPDHFLANLQSMGGLSRRGASARMVCKGYQVFALTDETLALPPRQPGTVISVFCQGDRAEGVTLRGLKYPLAEAVLTCRHPLGVSNEVLSDAASVSVRQGTLLVLLYDDPSATD